MALLHAATLTPSKPKMLAARLAVDAERLQVRGAYRFDDPDGEVGLEGFVADVDGAVHHVPLTYRSAPLPDVEPVVVAEHSVLGRRWVYDGLDDPVFVRMLVTTTLTGVGQSVELIERDGRWTTRPPTMRLDGGGWSGPPVAVDRLVRRADVDGWAVLDSDTLELRVALRPDGAAGSAPDGFGLTGIWAGAEAPHLLACVRLA